MARLLAFGANNGTHALSELDTVDLKAIALSHAWGVPGGHTERIPPSPCVREDCGGSVLVWDGERRCILCCRPPVAATAMTPPDGYGPRNGSGKL